mgnify:CR=1 FL=1
MSNSLPEPPKLPPLPQRPNLGGGAPAPQQPPAAPQGFGAPQFGGQQPQGFGAPQQPAEQPQPQQGFGAPQQFGGYQQEQPQGFGAPQPQQPQGQVFGAPQFGGNPQQFGGQQPQGFGSPENGNNAGYPPNGFGNTPPVPQEPKKNKLPWILGGVGAVVLLVAGTLVFLNLNKGGDNTATPGGGTSSQEPGDNGGTDSDTPAAPAVDVTEVHSITLENGSTLKFGLTADTVWTQGSQEWTDSSLMTTGGYSTEINGVQCSTFVSGIPDLMEDVDASQADYVYDSFVGGYLGEPTIGGGNTVDTVSFEEVNLPSPDSSLAIPGRHYTIPVTGETKVFSTMYAGVDFDRAPRSLVGLAYACQSEDALNTLQTEIESGSSAHTLYTWIE